MKTVENTCDTVQQQHWLYHLKDATILSAAVNLYAATLMVEVKPLIFEIDTGVFFISFKSYSYIYHELWPNTAQQMNE